MILYLGFPGRSVVKKLPAMQEIWVWSLCWETATHSSILAWEMPWTEGPVSLQPMGRRTLDTTERLSTHTHTHDAGPIALPQVHSPQFLPKLSLQQQLHFQSFSIIFKLLTLWKYAFIVYTMGDIQKCFLNGVVQTDFSDGSVVKNSPANAGDAGSDPGQ